MFINILFVNNEVCHLIFSLTDKVFLFHLLLFGLRLLLSEISILVLQSIHSKELLAKCGDISALGSYFIAGISGTSGILSIAGSSSSQFLLLLHLVRLAGTFDTCDLVFFEQVIILFIQLLQLLLIFALDFVLFIGLIILYLLLVHHEPIALVVLAGFGFLLLLLLFILRVLNGLTSFLLTFLLHFHLRRFGEKPPSIVHLLGSLLPFILHITGRASFCLQFFDTHPKPKLTQ
mmetsp:Transcript_4187/g.15045  ORF Transcript_4187/g.15045 Transcript_4187/m.15045 type:complete len:233 (-) Transcript_4187:271-969(-)